MADWMDELLSADRDVNGARRALLEVAETVSGSGCWAWDPVSDASVASANLLRIHGMDPDLEMPNPATDVLRFVHPDDRARVERALVRAREGDPPPELDYRIVTPNGEMRFIHAVLAETTADERPLLVGWLRDVTAARETTRELALHTAVASVLSEWDNFESAMPRLLSELARALERSCAVLKVPEEDGLVERLHWRSRQAVGDAVGSGMIAIPLVAPDGVLAIIEVGQGDRTEPSERLNATLTGIGHEIGAFLARRAADLHPPELSSRELELLRLAADGLSGPQIAKQLFLSPATVKTHFENIYRKYGVPDRTAAVAKALREGLLV